WSGSASLDVVEIDAASNRGVDDARDLRERAMYEPSGDDSYKVYIVDEAHMLTREAWNALLKILEEPPPRVVFVFATTEPQKIAQAAAPVLSRLQRFDFKRIGPAEIRDRLAHVLREEKIDSEPEALAAIARAADGSMRDALSLADQVLSMGDGTVTADRVRDALGLVPEDEFIAMLDLIADHRAADVFPAVARLSEAGVDFGGFLTGLADMLRSMLAVVLGGVATEMSERGREALVARKERFTAADLLRMLQALGELEPRFKKSGQQQMLVETLLVRFALLDHAVDLEDVLRSLGGDSSGGGAAPSRRDSSGGSSDGGAQSRNRSGTSTQSETRGPRAEFNQRNEPQAQVEPRNAPQSIARSAPQLVTTDAPQAAAAAPKLAPVAAPQRSPDAARRPFAVLEINKVAESWDELVEKMRVSGKPMLATALEHASPVAVSASGLVTIALDEPNDIYAHAITTGRSEIVAALAERFARVDRVELRRDESAAPSAPPKRLTDEMVRAERIAALRKRDPVLRAAIDALDLDVVD
ncbi:MAG: DNA polymerase III subunit gamma/tau, partial [Gemmatimonadaceae bacterium]